MVYSRLCSRALGITYACQSYFESAVICPLWALTPYFTDYMHRCCHVDRCTSLLQDVTAATRSVGCYSS
eukprot:8127-Eustigmatos_ZCMA.PRE.1